jgi:hypothetical protein
MPPSKRILELEILQVANLLRGIVILMSRRVIFFRGISNLSMDESVPNSLLYPPNMKIIESSKRQQDD